MNTPFRDRLSADLTDEQILMVQSWRADALMKMPYMSRILFALRPVAAPGLGTFAVDTGLRLYIDFDAVKDESQISLAWSMLHEAGHIFQEHAVTAKAMGISAHHHRAWNVAGDFAINDDLRDAGADAVTEDWMQVLPSAINEPDYQTPMHYFRKLMEMQPKSPPPPPGQQGQPDPSCPQHGNKPEQDQPQDKADQKDGSDTDDSKDQQDGKDETSGPDQQDSTGNQDKSEDATPKDGEGTEGGGEGGTCPEDGGDNGAQNQPGGGSGQPSNQPGPDGQGGDSGHDHGQSGPECTCPGQGSGSGQGDGQGQGMPDFKGCGSGSGGEAAPCELDPDDDLDGSAPAASTIEKENINIATAAAIRDYAAKGRGTIPGGLVELANKILAPSKTPWDQVLRSHVRRALASKMGSFDTDRSKRSRRRHAATIQTPGGRRRLVVPGYVQPVPRLLIVRDTSGSMSSDDMAAAGREIEAVAKQVGVRGDDLMVMDVDAAVHQIVSYKDRKSVEKVAGRGGTNMIVGIQAACDMKDKPTAIVVLTDGGTPWPSERPSIPVVAAIIPQGEGGETDADRMVEGLPDFIKGVVVASGKE